MKGRIYAIVILPVSMLLPIAQQSQVGVHLHAKGTHTEAATNNTNTDAQIKTHQTMVAPLHLTANPYRLEPNNY